ncbi:MAG: GGDEF domain-containing protein [Wenzhouxiangellaceae bacterium]|nr:GGDEF domain-containing protein [Wenzhouxiangellaceae bacterium]
MGKQVRTAGDGIRDQLGGPGSQILTRMRADIRLAVLTLYCLSAMASITPFALYRLYEGRLLLGLAELAVVGAFVVLTFMAWRSGKSQLAADLTACAASAGTVALVLLMDINYLWTFSTLAGNFLMARRWLAVLASVVVVLSIGLQPAAFPILTDRLTYLAVSVLLSLLGLIYATRVNHHYGQLNDMLSRDALTGALNRRALDHDLQAITREPAGWEHSLLILDLDAFKQLNDNHGHDAGDQALIDLARIVHSSVREKDRFYRFGGDEFVLLLPHTALSGAQRASEKLREALLHQLKGPSGIIRASMGLAQSLPGETAEHWMKRADDALLAAKQAGKDRVVTAS